MSAATAINVLVIFYSRYGAAESIALGIGVGAIQSRASIRLRRLPDGAQPDTIAADPEWATNLRRMHRDYVPPRPADPLWADVICLVTTSGSSREADTYLDSLRTESSLAGRLFAPVVHKHRDDTVERLRTAGTSAGLVPIPELMVGITPEEAQAFGRHITNVVRTRNAAKIVY